MNIYVASSWRNEFQPEVVKVLRELCHEVYDFRNPPNGKGGFHWSAIDTGWEMWETKDYREALNHPIAKEGFASDFDAMKWADCCVMMLPCGRSASAEAGWFAGTGKKVYVLSPIKQEPELMYKMFDGILCNMDELRSVFS